MKKRYLVLAGVLAISLIAAGCGKKQAAVEEEPAVTATPTPEPEVTQSALVEMEKSEDSDITNVMGEKSVTSSKVILVNSTGNEVSSIYIRPNTDDDSEWGDELVKGKFVLKDSDKALYYFDPSAEDSEGNTVTSYDIRIVYTDGSLSECYFRKIPLKTISQITLLMDGTGEDAIPYAEYVDSTTKKTTSTLEEVKKRLGLLDSDDDESDEDDDNFDEEERETAQPTATPEPSQEDPESNSDDQPESDPSDTTGNSDPVQAAESCIGQSLDALIAACGDPTASEYQEEPETGETGYHYYDTFTVSTTVDENGNEIVAGVW